MKINWEHRLKTDKGEIHCCGSLSQLLHIDLLWN